MTAFFKSPICAGAVGASTLAPFDAAATARLDAARAGQPPPGQASVPAAILAHGTSGRWRIRLQGRRTDAFLDLTASEIAWNPDVLRIRINRASSSLVVWVRDGSELWGGDGSRVVALVSETLRRIARGQRSCAAPIVSACDDGHGFGLSHLLRPAAFVFDAG